MDNLKQQRRKLEKKFFFSSIYISLLIFLVIFLFSGIKPSTAFIVSSVLVSLNLLLLIEISGSIFDSHNIGVFKMLIFVFFKLLLFLILLYGIITIFYKEPLPIFLGISLPVGVSVFWGAKRFKE